MGEPAGDWGDLYAGVPLGFQILFWILLVVAVSSFVSIITLAVAGRRYRRPVSGRHAAPPDPEQPGEDDYLWVFLVPALNEEVTIADSVSRLAATRATHRRILVIDDGSEDRTPEILAGLDEPGLRVLTRRAPEARVGKGAALNDAYRQVERMLAEPEYAGWSSERVVVGIVDADGRLDPDAPAAVARRLADPSVGGVQLLVRIYNRHGFLTWAQDVEFGSFGLVYQAGRAAWGTANMGGNGQFNRLSALEAIDVDGGPWRDRLTEDQDLGVRMVQSGWRGSHSNEASIHQQGVPGLRRLYRQRTRWAQGGWQSIALLAGVGRTGGPLVGRIDAVYYLLTPVLQLAAGLGFAAAIVLAVWGEVPIVPASTLLVLCFLVLGFGPGLITLVLRGRGPGGKLSAVVAVVPYTVYSWLVFPVVLISLGRQVVGRTSWRKTDRVAIETHQDADPPSGGPGSQEPGRAGPGGSAGS
ncbi:glycosyltransferase family 2 protein [Agromyces seonyuensis]|uniref:Glycosyltransferase n=1 Tax=Agromyces seonyuensis TaxID=2662446 RepID=A0A6I4NVB9_9MICO|nr:glycosyltransferase family 2 protein [Agromyces seonyuensis]MWB98328.1 glycosyltransferase [Agromyces seonyuensis]